MKDMMVTKGNVEFLPPSFRYRDLQWGKTKRSMHIGDFSNWKDEGSYRKAFERLLRDLKASGGEAGGE